MKPEPVIEEEVPRNLLQMINAQGVQLYPAKKGQFFRARCPLHADEPKSLFVFPDRGDSGRWRCFSRLHESDAGGDAAALAQALHKAGLWSSLIPSNPSRDMRGILARNSVPDGRLVRGPDDDERVLDQLRPLQGGIRTQLGRFSARARSVLAIAQEEAHRFNHNYIGVEHILLGLVGETDGVGSKVLSSLTLDLSKVSSAVELIISPGEKRTQRELSLTPSTKKVLSLAVDEARRMSHIYVGTEHLLIGLLLEGGGVAGSVLETLGVKVDKARAETYRILGHRASSRASGSRDNKITPID